MFLQEVFLSNETPRIFESGLHRDLHAVDVKVILLSNVIM